MMGYMFIICSYELEGSGLFREKSVKKTCERLGHKRIDEPGELPSPSQAAYSPKQFSRR